MTHSKNRKDHESIQNAIHRQKIENFDAETKLLLERNETE